MYSPTSHSQQIQLDQIVLPRQILSISSISDSDISLSDISLKYAETKQEPNLRCSLPQAIYIQFSTVLEAFFFFLFRVVIFLRAELSSRLEMVATKHCLKVCCSTDQTKETSSCHLESDREVEPRQVCGGDQKHPATTGTVQRDGAGNNLWWSIAGIHENWLCLELGRWAAPAGMAAQASPGGGNRASGSSKLCSLLNHSTSLLSHFFFHLLHVYSGLEPLSFAPGIKSSGFPLVLFLPGLRYSKPSPQRKYNALHIGSLNTKKKNQPNHKRPPSHTANFYTLGASTLLLISSEVEGCYLF